MLEARYLVDSECREPGGAWSVGEVGKSSDAGSREEDWTRESPGLLYALATIDGSVLDQQPPH